GGGHRDRAGRGAGRGARRQGRAAPVRRRAGAAGRVPGAGRGGPVRTAVPGARRAGRDAAADRPGVRQHAHPARLGVVRPPRPDRAARPGAVRPGRPPHRGGAVQGGGPGAARGVRAGPAAARGAEHERRAVTAAGAGPAPGGRRKPSVVVLDYGSGNLRSAERALARAGAAVTVTADQDAALAADGLVLPGVGAFAACMAQLSAVDGVAVVRKRVAQRLPVLGICVGMQVLFEAGDEHGVHTAGIGLLPGTVRRLAAPVLPHMGWNTVAVPPGSVLFRGVERERFYFVHSYAAVATAGLVSTAQHGEPVVAAVEDGPPAATPVPPENARDTRP